MKNLSIDEMWARLEEEGLCEQALQLATDLMGYSKDTMCAILLSYTGYRTFAQLDGERTGDWDDTEDEDEED